MKGTAISIVRCQRVGGRCEPITDGKRRITLEPEAEPAVSHPAKTALKVEDLMESAMSGMGISLCNLGGNTGAFNGSSHIRGGPFCYTD